MPALRAKVVALARSSPPSEGAACRAMEQGPLPWARRAWTLFDFLAECANMIVVEQDGVRTDRRVPAVGWLARRRSTHPGTIIVLRTLLVADVGLLFAMGMLFALFMEHPAGLVAAGCCWGLAALLMNASRVARWLARRRHP